GAFDNQPNAFIELLSVKKDIGRFDMIYLYVNGQSYYFHDIFKKPTIRSSWKTGSYKLSHQKGQTKISVDFLVDHADIIRADYIDPDGERSYAHNTEIANAKVVLEIQGQETLELLCQQKGHFETGSRIAD